MVSERYPTEGHVNASYTEKVRRVREVTLHMYTGCYRSSRDEVFLKKKLAHSVVYNNFVAISLH